MGNCKYKVAFYEVTDIEKYDINIPNAYVKELDFCEIYDKNNCTIPKKKARNRIFFGITERGLRNGDKKYLPQCMLHILEDTDRIDKENCDFNPATVSTTIYYPNKENLKGIFFVRLEKIKE